MSPRSTEKHVREFSKDCHRGYFARKLRLHCSILEIDIHKNTYIINMNKELNFLFLLLLVR